VIGTVADMAQDEVVAAHEVSFAVDHGEAKDRCAPGKNDLLDIEVLVGIHVGCAYPRRALSSAEEVALGTVTCG